MRNRVDKTVVLFISAYFSYEKDRVQHDTNDDGHEKNDAEDQLRNLAPIENNPSDVERDRECDQTCTERNKERDRPLAASETHNTVRSAGLWTFNSVCESDLLQCPDKVPAQIYLPPF
jgi:hypothetical protein